MAYIIGISMKVDGMHQVTGQQTVGEKRFNSELQRAINGVYPNDDNISLRLREILAESAQDGLKKFKSVHIGGKYFFSSTANNKHALKYIKE